ncbi:MAG: aminomethyl-transferring glycine dehydrogenase subunit GcvPA [Candidatus Hadarchaeales archaeon]
MSHHYIPSFKRIREEMLVDIGVNSVEDLFSDIPEEVRLKRPLSLPPRMSEQEVRRHVTEILSKNVPFTKFPVFLGGGVWPHYVPAHVKALVSRAEFLTSYTPYQAEVSQGVLQALFEYQSMICELVGLDVANASMYDWATALGEAALMCARVTERERFLVPDIMSRDRLSVLKNYSSGAGLEIVRVGHNKKTGNVDLEDLKRKLDKNTAGVYIENPAYLGFLEVQVDEIERMAHEAGAMFVVGVNPISLGLLKPPGEYGADIVVGEGQPLGNPVSFGGPALGLFACRGEEKMIRSLPGRISGMTTTVDGKTRGFVMALQTREQHIRRERATSNICSNETLCAIAAAIYLASMGPRGLRDVAEICASNAKFLMKRLGRISGVVAPVFESPHFNEFTMKIVSKEIGIEKMNSELLMRGVHGGKPLKREFPELGETSLVCATELHTEDDMNKFIDSVSAILEERL